MDQGKRCPGDEVTNCQSIALSIAHENFPSVPLDGEPHALARSQTRRYETVFTDVVLTQTARVSC